LKQEPNKDIIGMKGVFYIGISGLLLFFTYLCFVLQEINYMIVTLPGMSWIVDNLGCSYFIPTGWIMAGLSTFSLYVGYFQPEWVKKRWSPQ
jgi:hypothetical protein